MDLNKLPISVGEMDALIEILEEDRYIILEDEKTIEYLLNENVISRSGSEFEDEFTEGFDFFNFRGSFIEAMYKENKCLKIKIDI